MDPAGTTGIVQSAVPGKRVSPPGPATLTKELPQFEYEAKSRKFVAPLG